MNGSPQYQMGAQPLTGYLTGTITGTEVGSSAGTAVAGGTSVTWTVSSSTTSTPDPVAATGETNSAGHTTPDYWLEYLAAGVWNQVAGRLNATSLTFTSPTVGSGWGITHDPMEYRVAWDVPSGVVLTLTFSATHTP